MLQTLACPGQSKIRRLKLLTGIGFGNKS